MPRDTFKRAVGRLIDGPIGTEATLTNYTDDGSVDKHGDPEKTVDTTTHNVSAIFRMADEGDPPRQDLADGSDATYDVFVWVKASQPVHAADAANRYSTRITDETTGEQYDVIKTWNEKNGTILCACLEV